MFGALGDMQEIVSFTLLALCALLVVTAENRCMKKHTFF